MKPVIRYRSQLLYRRSYKPNRSIQMQPKHQPSRSLSHHLSLSRESRDNDFPDTKSPHILDLEE